MNENNNNQNKLPLSTASNEYNCTKFYKLQVSILDVNSTYIGNTTIDYKQLSQQNESLSDGASLFASLFAKASKQFASKSKLDSVVKQLKGVSITDLVYSCPREFIFDHLLKSYIKANNLSLDDVFNDGKLREIFAELLGLDIQQLRGFKLASVQSASINILGQLRAILGTALHNHLEKLFKSIANDNTISNLEILPEYRMEWYCEEFDILLVGKVDLIIYDRSHDKIYLYDYKFRYPSIVSNPKQLVPISNLLPDEDMLSDEATVNMNSSSSQYINENYSYESYILQFAFYYWLLSKTKPELANKVADFILVYFDGDKIEFVSIDSSTVKELVQQVNEFVLQWLHNLGEFKQNLILHSAAELFKFKDCNHCKYKNLCKQMPDRHKLPSKQ